MSSETLNTAGAFSQAKDLKNRIFFTILILIIYGIYSSTIKKINRMEQPLFNKKI